MTRFASSACAPRLRSFSIVVIAALIWMCGPAMADPVLDVGVTIAAGKQNAAILHQHHDRTGDFQPSELIGHQGIKKGPKIGSGELVDSRRSCFCGKG